MTLREVYPRLYISGHTRGLAPERSRSILRAANIRHVVCVAPRADEPLKASLWFDYTHWPLPDGKTIPTDGTIIQTIVQDLRNSNGVLIHCNAGRNRSSLIAALVMREFGLSSDEAIRRIRATRATALANAHFEAYLRSLDDKSSTATF